MNKKTPLSGLIALILALAITGCKSPDDPGNIPAATAIKTAAVTVTAPSRGATPVTAAEKTGAGYTCGAVSWSPNDNPFKSGTVYTASVTLTADKGYTFTGLTAATINAQSASVTNNTGKAVTLSRAFAATGTDNPNDIAITVAAVTITGPEKDDIPVTAAPTGGAGYTCGAVSWSPGDNPFKGGTVYTATVTLTANSGYTFTGLAATINAQNAAVTNNTGNTVKLSYTFAATNTKTVTDITIKTQPARLTYTHGDPLDLTGLVVTLAYDDGTTEDAALAGFASKNITTNPANGAALSVTEHNGRPVVVSYGSKTANTHNLTINAVESANRFEYYWVDQHGSLVTTGGGAAIVAVGETLIITPQGDGYSVVQWQLNGKDTGQSADTYTFSSTTAGKHIVGLIVEKNGNLYNTNITVTVQ
jgi:hypothetical protein